MAAAGTLACALLLAVSAAQSAAETLHVASARSGVTQPLLLQVPAAPRAVALLFAGGHGGVRFADDAPASLRGNFLLRAREQFVAEGIAVAVVGAASDRHAPDWLSDEFRLSAHHAQDIGAAVDLLRRRLGVPVWLVGTSRGTLSAAAVGLALGTRIDGVVLTAGMTSMSQLAIDRFQVPVLLVHHEFDTCRSTHYLDLRQVSRKLAAPRSETLTFRGGRSDGPACEAFAHHGFNGIETEVIRAIARWIAPGRPG